MSEAHAADQFPNGDWIVCTVEQSDYGSDAGDIYFWIFDSLAREKYHFKFQDPPSAEIFNIRSIQVLPDHGWIVDIAGWLCDFHHVFGSVLVSFDSLGNKKWELTFEFENELAKYDLAPDGNILCVHYEGGSEFTKIVKIDEENGEVLRSIVLDKENISSALFVPGTEDIITASIDSMRYFMLVEENQIEKYILSKAVKGVPLTELQVYSDTIFYGFNMGDILFVRFNPQLDIEYRFTYLSLPANQFQTLDSGVVTLYHHDDNRYGILFHDESDFDFIHFVETTLASVEVLKIQGGINNKLAVFGSVHSGNWDNGDSDYPWPGRNQAWFRVIDVSSEIDDPLKGSIRINEIIQSGPFQRDSSWNDYFNWFTQDYSGGDFKIQIINDGLVNVNSFWVNTHIGEVLRPWICPPYLMKTVFVDSISVAPGDSIWIDFGDIVAYDQWEFPSQFCFWTSGPNGRPDFLPYNNYFCTNNTVSIKQPEKSELQIFPNPANDVANVLLPENANIDLHWEVLNLSGQILASGTPGLHQSHLTIHVAELNPGMYILKLNNTSTKLLIAR